MHVDVDGPLIVYQRHRVFLEAIEQPEMNAFVPPPAAQGVDELLKTRGIDEHVDIGGRAGGPQPVLLRDETLNDDRSDSC
ncbi:hypothetical protein GCM10017602_01170 [Herbiconiux flava]|nr:hypothetical protein GCM10017602_01170 [Herbiconiux flava]